MAVSAPRIALFLVLVVGGTALDLATKSWIFGKLGYPPEPRAIVLVPGIFSFTTSLNEGALFGMGQGMALVFAGLAILAALGIIYWVIWGGAGRDTWLLVALGCILGGVFGNLYDRLGLPGLVWNRLDPRAGERVHAVRDWLHFEIQSIGFDWPVFNIADSLLVVGAAMLFIHAIFREGRQRAGDSRSPGGDATSPPAGAP